MISSLYFVSGVTGLEALLASNGIPMQVEYKNATVVKVRILRPTFGPMFLVPWWAFVFKF